MTELFTECLYLHLQRHNHVGEIIILMVKCYAKIITAKTVCTHTAVCISIEGTLWEIDKTLQGSPVRKATPEPQKCGVYGYWPTELTC